MKMNIRQIQFALELYRTGSINKTAKNLYQSPPNISNAIRSLEEELGYQIFIRTKKGVCPTEIGMKFFIIANNILEQYQELLNILETERTARFRLATVCNTPRSAYLRLCRQYCNFSRIEFSMNSASFEKMTEQVALLQSDIGIALLNNQNLNSYRSLLKHKMIQIKELCQIPFCITIGSTHPYFQQEHISPEDMQDFTFVDYSDNAVATDINIINRYNINMNRRIIIEDQLSRLELVASAPVFIIGCQISSSLLKQYNLRSFPIAEIELKLCSFLRRDIPKSKEVQQFLMYLDEDLREFT